MDGIPIHNRVDGTTERKLHAKVVDNILNAPTYMSRIMGLAKPFEGKTMDFTVDIERSTQFEWFTGLETLNSSAEDTTVTLVYGHTAGTQPKVGIMLESFANAGQYGTIPLDAFKYEKAAQEALQNVAGAIYGLGTDDQPNGLRKVAGDTTEAATIGGVSRSTVSELNAEYTNFSGTLTLAKLSALDDAASTGTESAGVPNINVTTFAIWNLYEQLLDPQLTANYNAGGFPSMPVRGDGGVSGAKVGATGGFMYLAHRGRAVIKDRLATAQRWFKLNEDTFGWFGRTNVPDEYRGRLTKVNLGSARGYESTAREEAPSAFNGWFYQSPEMMPNQAGTIARFYAIGQVCAWEPRKNAQGHTITGI